MDGIFVVIMSVIVIVCVAIYVVLAVFWPEIVGITPKADRIEGDRKRREQEEASRKLSSSDSEKKPT
jgi:hypothetical protein